MHLIRQGKAVANHLMTTYGLVAQPKTSLLQRGQARADPHAWSRPKSRLSLACSKTEVASRFGFSSRTQDPPSTGRNWNLAAKGQRCLECRRETLGLLPVVICRNAGLSYELFRSDSGLQIYVGGPLNDTQKVTQEVEEREAADSSFHGEQGIKS